MEAKPTLSFWQILEQSVLKDLDRERAKAGGRGEPSGPHENQKLFTSAWQSERFELDLKLRVNGKSARPQAKAYPSRHRPAQGHNQSARPLPLSREALGQIETLNRYGAGLRAESISAKCVQRAWRKLAFRYHPDRAGAEGASAFIMIQTVAEALSKECIRLEGLSSRSAAA